MPLHVTQFSRRHADAFGGAPVLRPEDKIGTLSLSIGAAVQSAALDANAAYLLLTTDEDLYFDISRTGDVSGLAAANGIPLLASDGARDFAVTPGADNVIGVVQNTTLAI